MLSFFFFLSHLVIKSKGREIRKKTNTQNQWAIFCYMLQLYLTMLQCQDNLKASVSLLFLDVDCECDAGKSQRFLKFWWKLMANFLTTSSCQIDVWLGFGIKSFLRPNPLWDAGVNFMDKRSQVQSPQICLLFMQTNEKWGATLLGPAYWNECNIIRGAFAEFWWLNTCLPSPWLSFTRKKLSLGRGRIHTFGAFCLWRNARFWSWSIHFLCNKNPGNETHIFYSVIQVETVAYLLQS